MSIPSIGFIGTGNMARAILEGLLAKEYPAEKLWATRRNANLLSDLSEKGVKTGSDNNQPVLESEIIVLSVKPQMMQTTIEGLRSSLQARRPLVVSVAAGISLEALDRWSGGGLPIARAMPNTPSLLGLGACGLFANTKLTDQQRQFAETIMNAVGISQWLNQESDIDKVIAVSGSGPAYYFLFMEKMIEAGVELGLDRETATKLTVQTASGAAAMAANTEWSPAELRKQVTSPGGTTEQAILSFEADKLDQIVKRAMRASANQAANMTMALCQEKV